MIWCVIRAIPTCPLPVMQLIIDRFQRLNMGWNVRALGEPDFQRLCERFGITLIETPLQTSGFYYRMLEKDYIAVDSRLTGARRLAVLFHEFAHFLLHTSDTGPAFGFHGVGRPTRKEREADVFALCAILPRPLLAARTLDDLHEEGFCRDLIEQRIEILKLFDL